MSFQSSQHTLLTTTRYALIVMLICYMPHFATAPWWLFIIVFLAIAYRLIADYFGSPGLNLWIRVTVVLICLSLLKIQYGNFISSGFFIGFLLAFIGLKCIEIHDFRDLKVLIICNFYLIFTALIVIQELWIITYMIIAILANLSLMLKISAPQASLRQIGGKSMKQLLIAIPLSILLFYVFPRIADPLWQVPSQSQTHIGFSENMDPGSVAEFFNDDSIALRVTFKNAPVINGYWKGLILAFYNGSSWSPTWYNPEHFYPLEELTTNTEADYEVVLEPHQKKWLFYYGYPKGGRPNLIFAPNNGLMSQNKQSIEQRFAYALTIQASPYRTLTSREERQNVELPKLINPRIKAWAKEHFASLNNDPKAFIAFLHQYIYEQPFWYTLTPPKIKNDKNQMDKFWFDTQKGFCEHYASAVTVILRSVGIPAHVILGYHGGTWNPLAQYLTIQQNDAHAWVEYWQEGLGWQELDPTSFVSPDRVDQKIKEIQEYRINQINYNDTLSLSWFQRSKLYFDSVRFFAERWLLFYNQETQRDLLQKIGLGEWNVANLLRIAIIGLIIFIILCSLFFQWSQKRKTDPLLIEYHLLQREFRRFNVQTHPSATLKQQCMSLIEKAPSLGPILSAFLSCYEQLRLHQFHSNSRESKKATLLLFKKLRKMLRQNKPSKLNGSHNPS